MHAVAEKLSRRVFLKRAVSSAAGLGFCCGRCVAPGLGFWSGSGAGSAMNVVLMILDTVRADRLGCYGNSEGITPAIDRFARDGVLFENCYSQAPWTLPAVASIFTSLYPSQHGAGGHESKFSMLGEGIVSVAELFKTAGRATGAVANVRFITSRFGVTGGFDTVDVVNGGRSNRRMRRAERTTDAALGWIDGCADKPFFLMVHYYDPHLVYDPPQPYRRRFASARDAETKGYVFGTDKDVKAMRSKGKKPSAETVLRLEKLYNGEVAYTDSAVGRFLEGLAERGLEDKTAVVLTADHGEEFLEHGGFEHGHTLYNELLHVPLVIRRPGHIGAGLPAAGEKSPARVGQTVRLIDIAPTMCEMGGIEGSKDFMGESMVGMFGGGRFDERVVFGEGNLWGPTRTAFCTGGSKLILQGSGDGVELYDLQTDPAEKKNLARQRPKLCDKMVKGLEEFSALMEARRGQGKSPALSQEDMNRLRSLGYVR